MRVAAAVIRGLEALAGAAVGLIPVLGAFALVRAAIAVGVSVSEAGYTPFIFLSVGFGAATVAFCALGAAGAGFAMRRGLRIGAQLMLAGAAGVLASSMADTLLAPILVPDVPRYLTGMASYVAYLFPAPLPLLVGAVLAFLTHRRSQALI